MPEEESTTTPPDEGSGSASDYEVIEHLGQGGMGTVYKAHQPRLDRYVALKVMSPEEGQEHSFAERFRREAQAMARLDHPNIVAVYDFGETDEGLLYLAMECIEGASLRQVMDAQSPLDPTWVVGAAIQICEGLNYAHVHQTIHRDIKPGNILVDLEGRIKILDFGLAKLVGTARTDVSLTATNMAMGTMDYIAPEQLEASAKVDHRADIYSLGVVLYEMFTSKLPRGAFFAPTQVRPELDPRIDDLVLRCLQTRSDERHQNVQEMILLLGEIQANPQHTEPALAATARVPLTPQTGRVPLTPQTARVPLTPQTGRVPLTPQTGRVAASAGATPAATETPPSTDTQPVSASERIAAMKAKERKRLLLTNILLFGGATAAAIAAGVFYFLRPADPADSNDIEIIPIAGLPGSINGGGPDAPSAADPDAPAGSETSIAALIAASKPGGKNSSAPILTPAPKDNPEKIATDPVPPAGQPKPESPTPASGPADKRFLAARAAFLEKLATEVEAPFTEKMDALRAKYDGALEREFTAAAEKTNLDLAAWIKKERARLKADEFILEPPGKKLPKNLRSMQEAFIEQRLALYKERKRAGILLLARTRSAFDKVQLALTTEDNLDEALLVKKERESLSREYVFRDGPDPRPLARYVRIELPGDERTLTLAEVEVFSNGTNVAPRGTATQSSTAGDAIAARAIDGNTSAIYNDNGQTHTVENQSNPWWEVDLGRKYPVERIVIHNRLEGQSGRLADFALLLLDEKREEVLAKHGNPGQPDALTLAFTDDPAFDIPAAPASPAASPASSPIVVNVPPPPTGPITFTPTLASKDLSPEKLAAPQFGQSVRNSIDMVLMGVGPGKFLMGEKGRGREERQHEVTLTHGFWLGKTEVTRAQWKEYMAKELITGYVGNVTPDDDNYPIAHIRIHQAREFCEKLTEAERRRSAIPPGFRYRLPTAAQWEYACRAGTTGPLYGVKDEISWPVAGSEEEIRHNPVGKKQPNAWGLHDMIGNLPEFCHDPPGLFSRDPATNPQQPPYLLIRDFKGTATYTLLGTAPSAAARSFANYDPGRDPESYLVYESYAGFRVALVPDKSIPPDLASLVLGILEMVSKQNFSGASKTAIEVYDLAEAEAFPDLRSQAGTLTQLIRSVAPVSEGKEEFPRATKLSPGSGHRYLLVDTALPWQEARDFAETFGAHLATLTSQAERDFITKTYSPEPATFWIGAEGKSSWKWVTGEDWNFQAWIDKQPDNVQLDARRFGVYCLSHEEGTWGDLDADIALPFLIEWDAQ